MIEPSGQVSAREWPARPDLKTPAVISRATKCENCGDGYHFTSAHASYLKLIEKRDAESQDPGQWRVGRLAPEQASLPDRSHGSFAFRGGHSVLWSEEREQRANSPLFASEAEITARNLLKTAPNDIDSHRLLGRIYLRQLSDA